LTQTGYQVTLGRKKGKKQKHWFNTTDEAANAVPGYAASANPTWSFPKSKTVWYRPMKMSPKILHKF